MPRQERDVPGPLPERRDVHDDDGEPEEEVLAERRRTRTPAQVAVRRRHEPHVDRECREGLRAAGRHAPRGRGGAWPGALPGALPPRRGRASRRSPPRSGRRRAWSAPVNAPFSAPKSSLSARVSGSAAAFTATNGPFARGERAWSRRAISSLPVPDSPVTRTAMSRGATRSTRARSSFVAGSPVTKLVALLLPREEARDEVDERARGRERLRDVVGRAESDRVDRLRDRAVGRQDDDGRRRRPRPDAPNQLEPVDLRHLAVGQDDVERCPARGRRGPPRRRAPRSRRGRPPRGCPSGARGTAARRRRRGCAPRQASAAGRERDATHPPPGRGASAAEPPLATARAFTIARPRPVPSGREVT